MIYFLEFPKIIKEIYMTTFEISFKNVVEQVSHWPPDYRLALAQEILRSLKPAFTQPATQSNTLEQALGLLATETTPPSDDTIHQWVRERQEEKYG
jgi:hypothetical protein